MAESNYSTKFPFAALPMRWLPTKELRAKANQSVVQAIAWDCILDVFLFGLIGKNPKCHMLSCFVFNEWSFPQMKYHVLCM